VDRARWRQSTGRRITRGALLAAGATHVAGHAAASPRVRVSPVFAFELWFLLEKLKSKIPRSMFLQNPYMILSWILDMLWELACLGSVPKIAQGY
jgi:hypothetical protein